MQIVSLTSYLPISVTSPSAEVAPGAANVAAEGLSPAAVPAITSPESQPDANNGEPQADARRPVRDADEHTTSAHDEPSSAAQQHAEQQEQLELSQLSQRDQEVRDHEQAHAAIGGQHAGAPAYSYTYGPDGQRYATSGEVAIDLSVVPGNPAATVRKMTQVMAAALAPAEPSAEDRQIAARAQLLRREAQSEMLQQQGEQASSPSVSQPERAPWRTALERYSSPAHEQNQGDVTQPGSSINLRV